MAFACKFTNGVGITITGSGADTDPYVVTSSFGAAGWVLDINQTGSSFASWTPNGGTWSSNGTVINQTDTSAIIRNASFNTRYPFAISMATADLAINSGVGGDQRAGIYIGNSLLYIKTTNSGTSYSIVSENAGSALVSNTSITGTGAGTFFTVKALMVGGQSASFWVNGLFIGTSEMGNTGDASNFNLYSYAASASFKNISVYTLNLPI